MSLPVNVVERVSFLERDDGNSSRHIPYFQGTDTEDEEDIQPEEGSRDTSKADATSKGDENDVIIKYRTEYVSNATGELVYFSPKAGDRTVTASNGPVLEYVTVWFTETHLTPKQRTGQGEADIRIESKGNPYIRILSPCVNEALRCVVDYFPDIDFSADTIKIFAPFSVLVFYEKELAEYCQRLEADSSQPELNCANRMAQQHIKVLQDFVKQQTEKDVQEERKRHARGYATFDMLWLLYKPGTDVYFDLEMLGEHEPYVLERVNRFLTDGVANTYIVSFWNMDADSVRVGPTMRSSKLTRFGGEKKITSLHIYPCEFLRYDEEVTDQDAEDIKQFFINRGKKWYKLRSQPSICQDFQGWTTTWPRRNFNSLVMVDGDEYVKQMTNETGPNDAIRVQRVELLDNVAHPSRQSKICECERCERLLYKFAVQPRFAGYSRINPLTQEGLTDHQYFLATREVEAFVFRTRLWYRLHISGFRDPQFDKKLLERLVLKQETKDLITDLTRMFIRDTAPSTSGAPDPRSFVKISQVHKSTTRQSSEPTWSADFVAGKGEGLTFLLHGKPGVGKTYTAECIAHHTERPLLTLTCSDIGVVAETIERELLRWFKLAEHWGALILIDEADIYMEERRSQDIERNHLVAGFIRALEYFKGILFLTTNRVGIFDEAFVSRIHVQIYYKLEDDDRDKVWDNFFQKLEDDRETTMRIPQATKDYTQSNELRELKWNGREIRNAFQVAVALAEARGEKDNQGRILIKKDHIKASVQMSNEFKDYLEHVHQKDPGRRALSHGLRYDAYGSQQQPN